MRVCLSVLLLLRKYGGVDRLLRLSCFITILNQALSCLILT